jgi:hypothetical protein
MAPAVKATPRVTASADVPPVIVSTLRTVRVLAKLPRVSVSAPAARSIAPLVRATPTVTTSAAELPVIVSTLAAVRVLAKLPSVS